MPIQLVDGLGAPANPSIKVLELGAIHYSFNYRLCRDGPPRVLWADYLELGKPWTELVAALPVEKE